MYSAKDLSEYPFFQAALQQTPIEVMHDPLTGVISRKWILSLVQQMVERGEPFYLAMLDLDNFKGINDTYGHHVGDQVLTQIATLLKEQIGSDGLVGRFGGDEFLFIYKKSCDYDVMREFLLRIYNGTVFRRRLDLGGLNLYVTATIGAAAYPIDAKNATDLFSLVDRVLYRGKVKGRNCFILYVESKHSNIRIPTLTRNSLYKAAQAMSEGFDRQGTVSDRLCLAFKPIRDCFHLDRLFLLDGNGLLCDVQGMREIAQLSGPAKLPGALYAPTEFNELSATDPELFAQLSDMGLEAGLFVKVGEQCLIFCPEVHTKHVWQDKELAMAFFFARETARMDLNS